MSGKCTHLDQVQDVAASGEGCTECLRTGDRWVHVRMCLICGQMGCCDSSKNQHARRHWEETGHPLIQSAEPGESWRWCYIDEVYL